MRASAGSSSPPVSPTTSRGEVSVTLIDKSDSFIFGYSKLAVMFGLAELDGVRPYYRDIAKDSVEFRQETITSIDPATRRVVTDGGTYDADILVVALGADLDPAATPGLQAGGYEFYSPEGADRARDAIMAFDDGAAVIGDARARSSSARRRRSRPRSSSITCSRERGVRDETTIQVLSPLPSPIPISPDSSAAILERSRDAGDRVLRRSRW